MCYRVEGILLTSPYVADCAVIGVWSEEQATELPRAYSSSMASSAHSHATDLSLT